MQMYNNKKKLSCCQTHYQILMTSSGPYYLDKDSFARQRMAILHTPVRIQHSPSLVWLNQHQQYTLEVHVSGRKVALQIPALASTAQKRNPSIKSLTSEIVKDSFFSVF